MESDLPAPFLERQPHAISLAGLDFDILLLILEQVNLLDSEHGIKEQSASSSATLECQSSTYYQTHKALPVVRLVSRDLNRLATPIRYRSFKLKFSNFSNDVALSVLFDVKRFTRHAIFDQKVSWELVAQHYDSIPRLETISWKIRFYDENPIVKRYTPIPGSILRSNVRIFLHAVGLSHQLANFIPPGSLVSLKIGYWSWSNITPSDIQDHLSFKQYLLAATNLCSFTYEVMDVSNGGPVFHLPKLGRLERMPPFEELTLMGYSWDYTSEEVKSSWNFSNLRALDIRGIDLPQFLSSIAFEDFANLRIFHTGDLGWILQETNREKGTTLLEDFLHSLQNLEELFITSRTYEMYSFDIFERMSKLKYLEYREKILGSGKTVYRFGKGIGIEKLTLLRNWCPLLQNLDVQMDIPRSEFPTFIKTLASFPRLRKATLYTTLHETDWKTGMESRLVNASYSVFEEASGGEISRLTLELIIKVGTFKKRTSSYIQRTSNQLGKYHEWVTGRTFSKHWKKSGEGRAIENRNL